MNTEPQKSAQSDRRASKKLTPKTLLKYIIKTVLHNWGWKLAALLLAVGLWAGLITQDPTLTRERTFTDVPISIVGNDSLRRNGLIVLSGLEDEALTARLRADVPQREYNTVSVTSYYTRVDLSRITETGEQTLRIITSSTPTYGTVQSVTPDSIDVVVDNYITNYRIPVVINTIGDYPPGFYGPSPNADPSVVAVSGPKSIVDRITRVYVDFDISKLEPTEKLNRNALAIRFADAEGNAVESDLLEVTSAGVLLRSVIVQQQLYPCKLLPVSEHELLTGTPAEGYYVSNVNVTPSSVSAAGSREALQALESITTISPVDVSGKTEPFSTEARLSKPIDANHISSDAVMIEVTIEPISITRSFDNVKLSVLGADGSQRIKSDVKSIAVHLTGPQNEVQSLKSSEISAAVNVSGLDEGEHALPVSIFIENADMNDFSYTLSMDTVNVSISK